MAGKFILADACNPVVDDLVSECDGRDENPRTVVAIREAIARTKTNPDMHLLLLQAIMVVVLKPILNVWNKNKVRVASLETSQGLRGVCCVGRIYRILQIDRFVVNNLLGVSRSSHQP